MDTRSTVDNASAMARVRPTPPAMAEISERYANRKKNDFLGFEADEYLISLDFNHAKPHLREGLTEEDWKEGEDFVPPDRDKLLGKMLDYMPFAWEKALGERGISASRSVAHYVAWTWLAGDRAFSAQVDSARLDNYAPYGIPILEMICAYYGWDASPWR